MTPSIGHNHCMAANPSESRQGIDVAVWERSVCARMAGGDQAALGELYDQFGSFVFGLAARVIGDRHAAEDVTQDVFVTIWERPELFDPDRVGCARCSEPWPIAERSTTCDARRHGDDGPSVTLRWPGRHPTSTNSRWRS